MTVDGISPGWFGITQPTVGKRGEKGGKEKGKLNKLP